MDGTGRLVFPAVDMLDQMYARYTVQPATRRWTMAMFYVMFNIAAVNALVIYANNMRKDQPDKKIKRKYFLLRITHDLVTPFVTQRYKLSALPRNIKTAIVMCRFISDS
jgi:1,4-dihydroxy-2-naphthoate octaprenyltransferase